MRSRRWIVVAVALPLLAGLVGCAGQRAERNGKQLGDAICDIKNANSNEEVADAVSDADDAIEDGQQIVGRGVGEDVDDIEENLSDLSEHVVEDRQALARQDVAAIRRNLQQAVENTTGRTQRFYQGVDQGLSNCSDA